MKHRIGVVFFGALLLAISVNAAAADPVKEGESLQAAIDSAADGARILVEPGIYEVSNLAVSGKCITLQAIEGPERTILRAVSGIGLRSIFVFAPHSGNQSTIAGFTLSGANQSAVKIDGASPSLRNCFFIDNKNAAGMGAACLISNGSPQFENCVFRNGWADLGVGGVAGSQSHPTFINCAFINNRSPSIQNYNGSAAITNCSFIGTTNSNSSTLNGSIIYSVNSTVTILNTIVRLDWKSGAANEQPPVANSGTGSTRISYCDIEGSGGSGNWNPLFGTDGGHNIDVDPLFVSPTDLHLTALSLCINKGTADGAPTYDLDGDPRPVQGLVDIGVDEYSQLPVIETFHVYPELIKTDETAQISWNVTEAQSVRIDPDIGDVENSGTHTVSPDATTIYTLSATNIAGTVTRTVTLNVDTQPQIISFSANPSSIQSCTGSMLSWQTGSAETVTIEPEISSDLPLDGTQQVFPQKTTTYRITARSGDRTAQDSVTINVSGTNDSDKDGLPNDREDANQNGVLDTGETDSCAADTDNDGLPDGWEVGFGFDPLVADDPDADPDGDGYANAMEYFGDSNPTDRASIPYVLNHQFDNNGNLTQAEKVAGPGNPDNIRILP